MTDLGQGISQLRCVPLEMTDLGQGISRLRCVPFEMTDLCQGISGQEGAVHHLLNSATTPSRGWPVLPAGSVATVQAGELWITRNGGLSLRAPEGQSNLLRRERVNMVVLCLTMPH